jgi:twitching motility two-component system response regulator PilG
VTQDKIYLVGTLGLLKHEVRFIKIMLGLTTHAPTSRTQGRYELTEDVSKADIVIVNSVDNDAMIAWHKISHNKPAPMLLVVTVADQPVSAKYQLSRPFGPAKVLMLLDKIVKEQQEGGAGEEAESGIFSGEAKSAQREVVRTVPGVPARHRALVVDDSPTVRKSLVLELGSFNIQVDTAETGEQGLEMLEKNQYDIIFLDVVMPGADGYQVCKTIRRNQQTKLTPIVMLTSKSSPFDKVRGSLAGCSAYLTKPVEYENFYQVLEEYLALANNNRSGKMESENLQ